MQLSILTLFGCLAYVQAPDPAAKEAPPASSIKHPNFPKVTSPPTKTQDQVEQIFSGLKKYTDGKTLSEQDKFVCRPEISISQLQKRFAEVEDIAKLSTSLLAKRFDKTLRSTMQSRPELKRFLSLVADAVPDKVESPEVGMLWLATEAVAQTLCNEDDPKDLYTLSAALVHWASSEEMIYQSFFDAYSDVLSSPSYDMYWNSQQGAKSAVLEKITQLRIGDPGGFIPSSNVRTAVNSGGMPLKCSSDAEVSALVSPGLKSSGTHVTKDSQFYLSLECENTSSSKVMMSESLVQSGSVASCLATPSREFVLPELDPGEKARFVLGPFLATGTCSGLVSNSYLVKSSHYSSNMSIKVNMQLRDSELSIAKPDVDQDLPGASVENENNRLDEGDAIELLYTGRLDSNYHLLLTEMKSLPADSPSPFKELKIDSSFFDNNGSRHSLKNDIDLVLVEDGDWTTVKNARKNEFNKATTSGSGSIFSTDHRELWLQSRYAYFSSCKSSAEYLKAPLDKMYGAICEDVSYAQFSDWLTSLYSDACETQAVKSQIANLAGEKGVEGKLKEKLGGKDEGETNTSSSGFTKRAFIDPDYNDVVNAIDVLVRYGVIGGSDLKEALSYSDAMLFKQAKSRETARQLLLAQAITMATVDLFGPDELKNLPIYRQGAAIGILELEERLLQLKIDQSLQAQTLVTSTSNLNGMLQNVLEAMIAEGKCAGSAPIPPAPPHEIRNTIRYSTLPISLVEKK